MAGARKKKRRKRFHTGTHVSSKTGKPMNYRSSWEYQFMVYLDNDPTVQTYGYESLIIPYVRSARSRRISRYFPDFVVTYADGRTVIYEIKSQSFVARRANVAKFSAAKLFCESRGWSYEVLTQKELTSLGLLKRSSKTVVESKE